MTPPLPPSPPLPSIVQALLLARSPAWFTRFCQRRYGDVFQLKVRVAGLDMPGPVVYLADPKVIVTLFSFDGVAGHAGRANEILSPVVGPHSLLSLDGDEHLRERRLLAPAFHGSAIQVLEAAVRKAAEKELSAWPRDEVFPVRPAMQRITFEVIATAVFGINDPELRKRLLDVFEPVFNVSPPAIAPAFRVNLAGLSPWARFQRAIDRMDQVLFELIKERRRAKPREDILGLLLASTDESGNPLTMGHIRDELVTLLLAGHETTATALSWALERLAHHPEVAEKARETIAMANEEEYLDAIAAETLRVRPIVPSVARQLSEPVEIGDFRLPAYTTVMPAIYLVHGDPANHAEPKAFRPERFEDESPRKETWLPFGGGRRRCIGAALAQMEMRTVLAVLLAQYVPESVTDVPERSRRRGITFAPEHDALIRMRYAPIHRAVA